jgi:hypothetical protein
MKIEIRKCLYIDEPKKRFNPIFKQSFTQRIFKKSISYSMSCLKSCKKHFRIKISSFLSQDYSLINGKGKI